MVDLVNISYDHGFRMAIVDGSFQYEFPLTADNVAGILRGLANTLEKRGSKPNGTKRPVGEAVSAHTKIQNAAPRRADRSGPDKKRGSRQRV
jgi:hypothetical protein